MTENVIEAQKLRAQVILVDAGSPVALLRERCLEALRSPDEPLGSVISR